jgi:hypothetical protein
MSFFLMEDKMTEVTQLSPRRADAIQNAHLDVSSPRYVPNASSFQSREDEISFRRWRLGFFVFYAVLALMLGGIAVVTTDRSATFASAGTPTNPAIASADSRKHR